MTEDYETMQRLFDAVNGADEAAAEARSKRFDVLLSQLAQLAPADRAIGRAAYVARRAAINAHRADGVEVKPR